MISITKRQARAENGRDQEGVRLYCVLRKARHGMVGTVSCVPHFANVSLFEVELDRAEFEFSYAGALLKA